MQTYVQEQQQQRNQTKPNQMRQNRQQEGEGEGGGGEGDLRLLFNRTESDPANCDDNNKDKTQRCQPDVQMNPPPPLPSFLL